jgi:aspartate 1-decarboxylase
MLKRFLTSKIHRATITARALEYEGSLGLDEDLMDAANLQAGEMALVFNVNNGNRFETYVIPEKRGSRAVALYGAAARLGELGDRVIILAYGLAEKPAAARVIELDESNEIVRQTD